jgi:hypothetical protein
MLSVVRNSPGYLMAANGTGGTAASKHGGMWNGRNRCIKASPLESSLRVVIRRKATKTCTTLADFLGVLPSQDCRTRTSSL